MPWGQFDYSFGELFDDQFTSARALSMTSVVLGSILFLIILFMGCVSFRRSRGVKATGFFCFVEAILTAASFIALESKFCADADSCKLGYSAWVCVAAAALWFITSVFLCCMPSTAADERKSVLPTHQSQSSQEQDKVAATNAGRTNAQVY